MLLSTLYCSDSFSIAFHGQGGEIEVVAFCGMGVGRTLCCLYECYMCAFLLH